MEIKYWAGTDVGRKRSENEDNYLIDQNLRLFVVADGMGGHASGEIASALAVHTVREVVAAGRDVLERFDASDPRAHIEVCTLLEHSIHVACERIHEKAQREPEKRGMGTTLVVLLLIEDRGFIAYVGDSRIYLLRGDLVYQLTEDHSLMNELVRQGKIRADEFDDSPYAKLKHAMTRAVGVHATVEVDTLDFDVIPGDAFLLCSDGLYEYLDDNDIRTLLALPNVEEIPGRLIDVANTRGGKDNITALVVQVPGDGTGDRAAALNHVLEVLRGTPVFDGLSYRQAVRVLHATRQVVFEEGDVLCAEGTAGDEMFVIVDGTVKLTKDGAPITTLAAGDHFGEMALIDQVPRSATATAAGPGRALTLSRADFHEILRKEGPLAVKLLWNLLKVLGARLRRTTADLSEARREIVEIPDELLEEAEPS
ncbi:MAG: phosphoprotein phosphatase [Deltaproteobacteria bacterium]|nr:MAG: phosphoprotein phosphatase [Deltaproteobacteria bacterium]